MCPLTSEKSTYNLVATLEPSFMTLTGNEDDHIGSTVRISVRSENGLRSKLPLSVWKIHIDLQWELCSGHSSVPPFLIGSSLFLQVTRTTIRAGMSSNFNQIGLLTTDLAVLERLEKSLQTYIERNVVTTLAPSFLNGIFFILAGNKENHKKLNVFEFLPDSTTYYRVSCP